MKILTVDNLNDDKTDDDEDKNTDSDTASVTSAADSVLTKDLDYNYGSQMAIVVSSTLLGTSIYVSGSCLRATNQRDNISNCLSRDDS